MADELSLEELAREAGSSVSTIRYYIARGLLPRPKFKSKATRYGRDLAVRLRAIAKLRDGGMRIDPIKRKLGSMTAEELRALAGIEEPKPAPATAPKTLPEGFAGPYRKELGSERWEHVAICPGVVLMVKGEADAEAWRVAREIVAMFGGG